MSDQDPGNPSSSTPPIAPHPGDIAPIEDLGFGQGSDTPAAPGTPPSPFMTSPSLRAVESAPGARVVLPAGGGAAAMPLPGTPATVAEEKPRTDWWAEIRSFAWLVLAVLAVWSFIAKPFYIPSESMMPTLIKGDRLVVTKFPYGWSYVSPSPFHILPFIRGRLFGRLPARGDVVIVKPPEANSDYIKRVIGLPGDRIEVREGVVILNGTAVKRVANGAAMIPIDANVPCDSNNEAPFQVTGGDGKRYCALPRYRETLPNGVSYDTIDLGYRPGNPDDYPETVVPERTVFLMGDNRDESADSRVSTYYQGLGGPVPWENLGGRAELITFSYDGSTGYFNPLSWITALRGGRAGTSLRPTQVAPRQAGK